MKKCKYCNSINQDDYVFCMICGKRLTANPVYRPVVRSDISSDPKKNRYVVQTSSISTNQAYATSPNNINGIKRKHPNKQGALLVILAFVSVLALGIIAYAFYSYSHQRNSVDNTPVSDSYLNEQSDDQNNESITEPNFLLWIQSGKPDHKMIWSSSEVENAIRQATGIQNRGIMLSDVWELTSLHLSLHESFNLNDISEFQNLRVLSISTGVEDNSSLKNLSTLSGLTRLEELSLSGEGLQNVSPLSQIKSLHKLSLTGNNLIDINPLKELPHLSSLYIDAKNLRDISALSTITSLSELTIESRSRLQLDALSSLHRLRRLEISQCSVRDISPLSSLSSLESLELIGLGLQDISPLAKLKQLEYLNLFDNNINNIEPLKQLKNLKELYIHGNPISDSDIMLIKGALPSTCIISDEKESMAIINNGDRSTFAETNFEYSSYEGKWVAGQYLDSGNYDQELTIVFDSPTSFSFYWSKYRIADFKASAGFNPDNGFGYFSVNQSEYFSADGTLRFENNSVTLSFTRSSSPYVPAGSEFLFNKNVTKSGSLSAFPDGKYYAVFTNYGANNEPAVFKLYENITFSDDFVSTFQIGSTIKYGEGLFFTVEDIVPAGNNLSKKYITSGYGYVMQNRDGIWTLYNTADTPSARDLGIAQAIIPDKIKVVDNWYYLSNGNYYPYSENLRELAVRRAADGDEFKYRRYEMQIENGNVISLTLLGGPA